MYIQRKWNEIKTNKKNRMIDGGGRFKHYYTKHKLFKYQKYMLLKILNTIDKR